MLATLTACALAPAASAAGGPIESLQRAASSLAPPPSDAFGDRGQLADDGCMVEQHEYRFPKCVYGDKRSQRPERRIERHDEPDLVVTGSGVVYGAIVGGRRLGSKASAKHLRKGYARTMRRLRRTGARVAVMKTLSWAPNRIVSCVRDNPRKLRRCAFDRKQPTNRAFEARAAKRVKGARLVDARDAVCLKRICPAVTDGLIVYRDPKHLSATYARTLADWLDARLPRL